MLFGLDRGIGQLVILAQRWKTARGVVVVLGTRKRVITRLLVKFEEALEHHDRTACPEGVWFAVAAFYGKVGRGLFEFCRRHLAGDGALPDQVVEAGLIGGQVAHLVRRPAHIRRPDRLVGFLRVLGL